MGKASKVTVKGQVLIPGDIRKRHHIEPGSEVRFVEYGNVVCIAPVVANPVAAASGKSRGIRLAKLQYDLSLSAISHSNCNITL